MTIKAFKAKIEELGGAIEVEEPYNTNNSWGFGGMVGTRIIAILDGVKLFFDHGQLCYRHLDPEHEDHVHVEAPDNKPFATSLFFKLYEQGARLHTDYVRLWNDKSH